MCYETSTICMTHSVGTATLFICQRFLLCFLCLCRWPVGRQNDNTCSCQEVPRQEPWLCGLC